MKTQKESIDFNNMMEAVCRNLPEGWSLVLDLENGAATVRLYEPKEKEMGLPDPADKTLVEQMNDALLVANGWVNVP